MTWDLMIQEELKKPYFQKLVEFLKNEDKEKTVFPKKEDRLACFRLTPYETVKVVIIGQDPYHDIGQAHGLSFSVKSGKFPPSLQNIYKELTSDLNITYPTSGDLTPWAKQGVLLLNTVLTVVAHQPLSHRNQGWETFTLEAVKKLNEKDHIVFILWGAHAQKMKAHIDSKKHVIIESVHPSPLSAHRGFFGSKPFSKTNEALTRFGYDTIHWKID